ncbi:MAG: hypothetical protein AUH75_04420 [Gemmatimonadetes bacterium 13_1_40CM_4_65_7]|nr:MAG: hypothetical protein AUH75_04420 [Gemmatimonadetes bacterium 13_1_40CM_4_65_7]
MLRAVFRVGAVAVLIAGWATACDGGLAPEPICARGLVGVCGTIHFRGSVPDSTDNVFVAAYLTFPQTCNDLINNRRPVIPGSVPYTDSAAAYSMTLDPGTYHWVVAVWKKVGMLHLSAIPPTRPSPVSSPYRQAPPRATSTSSPISIASARQRIS